MTPTSYSENLFQQNNEAVSNIVLQSESGKSANEWRKTMIAEFFPILTAEEIQQRDKEKDKLFMD